MRLWPLDPADQRDLDIIAMAECGASDADIAWIIGEPVQIIETRRLELLAEMRDEA